jgi:hypothetical protein
MNNMTCLSLSEALGHCTLDALIAIITAQIYFYRSLQDNGTRSAAPGPASWCRYFCHTLEEFPQVRERESESARARALEREVQIVSCDMSYAGDI